MMSEETIDFLDNTEINHTIDHLENELLVSHASTMNKLAAREQLNREIEDFISNGGKIHHIDPDIMADPPKKPENRYGSHPI